MRRPVAVIVAFVLFAEALGIAWLNWTLGILVDNQNMSVAGLDPDVMSTSSKAGGIGFGVYFALCALVAALVAVRNRHPAGAGRVLLISAAVVHALLGAVAWSLLGTGAFGYLMVVLALIVLLLMTYEAETDEAPAADAGEPSALSGPPAPTAP